MLKIEIQLFASWKSRKKFAGTRRSSEQLRITCVDKFECRRRIDSSISLYSVVNQYWYNTIKIASFIKLSRALDWLFSTNQHLDIWSLPDKVENLVDVGPARGLVEDVVSGVVGVVLVLEVVLHVLHTEPVRRNLPEKSGKIRIIVFQYFLSHLPNFPI